MNKDYENRYVLKVAGESGQGVISIGEILAKALKNIGLYIFGYREYPSLIKGGHSCYQIDIADTPIKSSLAKTNLLLCLSRVSVQQYLKTVAQDGIILHNVFKMMFTAQEDAYIKENNIKVIYVPAEDLASDIGGKRIMSNTILLGIVWQLLGLDLLTIENLVKETFAHKPQVIEPNLKCLSYGYGSYELPEMQKPDLKLSERENCKDDMIMTGNHAIALGAVAAGVRAYYAYPMTPSSSILSYLASIYHKTGMIVKQIEDEISVAQMAIGSMHMGARTLIGTAGGGFDLMTESISLVGITETPLVCVIAQRPGPATGLPTWTSAGDLNIAVYAGHGEFARLVLAASDIETCYTLTQKAFNLAEKYQIAVMVLTEKQIAESLFQVDKMPENLPIERHILSDEEAKNVKSSDRYKLTENGVSPRWLPGQSDAVYNANSDEHLGDGSLTEDAEPAKAIYYKRILKEKYLLEDLEEPVIYGSQPQDSDIAFVGWGSVKNTVLDAMPMAEKLGIKVSYLHYENLYPVKTKVLSEYVANAKNVVLIENNATGQLGHLLTSKTGILFEKTFFKWDGRPFFLEEVLEYIKENK